MVARQHCDDEDITFLDAEFGWIGGDYAEEKMWHENFYRAPWWGPYVLVVYQDNGGRLFLEYILCLLHELSWLFLSNKYCRVGLFSYDSWGRDYHPLRICRSTPRPKHEVYKAKWLNFVMSSFNWLGRPLKLYFLWRSRVRL